MFKKVVIMSAFGIVATLSALAQDQEYSQFYAQPLFLNPAMTGTGGGPRLCLGYRNQWPGIQNAYNNAVVSYDQNINAINSGIGLLVTNDNQGNGVFKEIGANFIYSFQVKLGDNFVARPAIRAGYNQRTVDGNGLVFAYDANGVPQQNTVPLGNKSYADFGAGVVLFSDKFFVGAAADHLTEPNISTSDNTSKLPMKITAHVGSVLPVGGTGSNTSISPNLLYSQQGAFSQINAGFYFQRNVLVLGAWGRYAFTNLDAIIALIGFKLGVFKIGYSYDINTSALKTASYGAHEVSLSVQLGNPKKVQKSKYQRINCPTF